MEIISVHTDIQKFIYALDDKTNHQIVRILELLEFQEYRIGMPYSKKIEKDLYELRIKSTLNIRIFYTFYNSKIYLLHIINKEKQKLLPKDIDTARRRLASLQS
jgi:phage-related protein